MRPFFAVTPPPFRPSETAPLSQQRTVQARYFTLVGGWVGRGEVDQCEIVKRSKSIGSLILLRAFAVLQEKAARHRNQDIVAEMAFNLSTARHLSGIPLRPPQFCCLFCCLSLFAAAAAAARTHATATATATAAARTPTSATATS